MSYKKTKQQEIARRLRQREESKRKPVVNKVSTFFPLTDAEKLIQRIWDATGDPPTHFTLPDNVDIDEHIEAAETMLGLKHE